MSISPSVASRFSRWLSQQCREYRDVVVREWVVRPSGAHNVFRLKFDMAFPRSSEGNAYCVIKGGWHRHAAVYGTVWIVVREGDGTAQRANVRFGCYCGKAPPGKKKACSDPSNFVEVPLDVEVAADIAGEVGQQVTGQFREARGGGGGEREKAATTSSTRLCFTKKEKPGRRVKRRIEDEAQSGGEEAEGGEAKRARGAAPTAVAPEVAALFRRS